MKWLTSRYVFPLAVITLMISFCLQCVWIKQLYLAQTQQVKSKLESIVSNTSKQMVYRSVSRGRERSSRFKQFFLSSEWFALRQAFDELKVDNLHSQFHYGIDNDSTVVELRMSFLNDPKKRFNISSSAKTDNMSPHQVSSDDQRDLKSLDSMVNSQLQKFGVKILKNYALYDYSSGNLIKAVPFAKNKLSFVSERYTYNLKFLHRYQLVLDNIFWIVVFQMRYYLISSLVMLVLTAAAFYLLIKLMKNQQLYAQAKMAFTSNMTHELQTPISTIVVALESIKKYQLADQPEKLENYINISVHELQRLQAMIEKVLKQEQMDLGETKLQFSLIDLQPILQQVIHAMEVQVQEKNASIIFSQKSEPLFVKGDAMHISNVFYNLIDNALKYSPADAKIEVLCSIGDHQLTVSFKDNGPGINEIYQQQVFERFFRIFNQDNIHNVKGSGLGLHYVKQVIALHGGRVELHSKVGKGCNFVVILPLYEEN
ncbi:sensor histidine kinase KdpD [uncultured Pedobacter sp.]|uniref:sensor histidine kinase n=1 Tax=uncultured Pedobacter sp. TaxID=246139 RepID=UPI0025E5D9DD|nr:HAMP domain-containing sensor histidine kinase [uncultured Pedobacter sp.]